MTQPTTESRYPLHLTVRQLNALKTLLDAATVSEADPDAEVFELLDLVREARRQAANLACDGQADGTENKSETY
ncbi:hypothetical protein [Pseudomonas chlororaphis]|uniref:hypothetical protein n=1 Tax=Pseudomonas chlororaphis TaxID=587753 RepID=UPI002D792CBF|nr:hypothetical protein [Pseudomonas chlororaphis]